MKKLEYEYDDDLPSWKIDKRNTVFLFLKHHYGIGFFGKDERFMFFCNQITIAYINFAKTKPDNTSITINSWLNDTFQNGEGEFYACYNKIRYLI